MEIKAMKHAEINTQKKKRRDKSDLGPNFVAPDGGWGWVICFAGGLSNLSIFPVIQQFGLIFRERLMDLNITNSQITTLINANNALSSVTGLINGPIFRRFSFRQVALGAALLVVLGLYLTAIAESFLTYLISLSILYGAGFGLYMSCTSLALNTYFKEKRRFATGFSWTMTSLGPMIMPYLVTVLLTQYGVEGTVLIFTGIAMHAIAGALVLQPVEWHTAPLKPNAPEVGHEEHLCAYCRFRKQKASSLFSSQYLYNADDENMPGYEIIDPGTPMLSRANDGWFSHNKCDSKLSLASRKWNSNQNMTSSHRFSSPNFGKYIPTKDGESAKKPLGEANNFSREKEVTRKNQEAAGDDERPKMCTCEEERKLLVEDDVVVSEEPCENISFWRKVVIFFDLDLLKDMTYVILMLGITLANFAEMNFSILTPFILSDFGFTKPKIALAMSLLASLDSGMRFLIPFIAERIGWENRTFFLVGVLGMAGGRIIIAHIHTFEVILVAMAWIGMCKALRTIFLALVIPSYVPLNRLPAASGLQLLISGLFTLTMGPIVGVIRDMTNYTITLHCLNVLTFTTAIFWTLESLHSKRKRRKLEKEPEDK